MKLGEVIKEGNMTSLQDKSKATIFLRHHIQEGLWAEYKDPSNMLLQQQYRECNFKKYSELISCLRVVEQKNELFLRNHQTRPTGSQPFPKVNATTICNNRGHGRGPGQGQGHGRNNYQPRGGHNKKFQSEHPKWKMKEATHKTRIMKTSAIDVEERAISHIPIVSPST
ncbi:hypothetical protein Pint_22503 [Pistacia integerrima]|uniref:Uncharacterized protein n=1 Tax=Pistacia integerrima TaxID=434235 RepID=A0ACC0YK99_9ROSI|nr:hypothetical protein Pint_22503 [Pistacia integerrima]